VAAGAGAGADRPPADPGGVWAVAGTGFGAGAPLDRRCGACGVAGADGAGGAPTAFSTVETPSKRSRFAVFDFGASGASE
jgi:hypothetical protein